MPTQLETIAAALRNDLGNGGMLVHGEGTKRPRFELFHGANSICSQKVRTVLAHHQIGYVAHSLSLYGGQTYLPNHVCLRMIGCDELEMPLVTTHEGSTSMTAGGCDPAVVPTLIDWATGRVILDSKRICLYLDEQVALTQRLCPPTVRERVEAELLVVDNLPNYQMLNGLPPGEDLRPLTRRGDDGTGIAKLKVGRLDGYLAQFANDPILVRAYDAKRAKERAGGERLFSAQAMLSAYARAQASCDELDSKLEGRTGQWLFGDVVSMADLFWIVELARMENLGVKGMWVGKLKFLTDFLSAGVNLRSIKAAVIDWPGALY